MIYLKGFGFLKVKQDNGITLFCTSQNFDTLFRISKNKNHIKIKNNSYYSVKDITSLRVLDERIKGNDLYKKYKGNKFLNIKQL